MLTRPCNVQILSGIFLIALLSDASLADSDFGQRRPYGGLVFLGVCDHSLRRSAPRAGVTGTARALWRLTCVVIAFHAAACQNDSTSYLLEGTFVKSPFRLSPTTVTVPVLKTIQFSASGGTPPYSYTVFSGGGSISGAVYTAPNTIGNAVVSAKDSAGTQIAALITIVTDANCPANYIPVTANSAVGTSADFCISKYEMKCNNDTTGAACTGSPVSMAANRPWVNVTQPNAKSLCAGLGTQYHLVTNPEWMTIARSIEATAANWSSGTVSSGALNRGHSDNSPANTLSAGTDDLPCSGTGDTCSTTVFHDQRRTHVLANGQTIWDFAGNVKELIDWIVTTNRAGAQSAAYEEINSPAPTAAMPANTFKSNDTNLLEANGIGAYWRDVQGSNGYAARGGYLTNGTRSGVYHLDFEPSSTYTNALVGFRCAYQ